MILHYLTILRNILKKNLKKPGNVFCGVIHRLDRPTSGVVLFARTSKALSRLNLQFQKTKNPKKHIGLSLKKTIPLKKQKIGSLS